MGILQDKNQFVNQINKDMARIIMDFASNPQDRIISISKNHSKFLFLTKQLKLYHRSFKWMNCGQSHNGDRVSKPDNILFHRMIPKFWTTFSLFWEIWHSIKVPNDMQQNISTLIIWLVSNNIWQANKAHEQYWGGNSFQGIP